MSECFLKIVSRYLGIMFFPSNVVDMNQQEFVQFENFSLNSTPPSLRKYTPVLCGKVSAFVGLAE